MLWVLEFLMRPLQFAFSRTVRRLHVLLGHIRGIWSRGRVPVPVEAEDDYMDLWDGEYVLPSERENMSADDDGDFAHEHYVAVTDGTFQRVEMS